MESQRETGLLTQQGEFTPKTVLLQMFTRLSVMRSARAGETDLAAYRDSALAMLSVRSMNPALGTFKYALSDVANAIEELINTEIAQGEVYWPEWKRVEKCIDKHRVKRQNAMLGSVTKTTDSLRELAEADPGEPEDLRERVAKLQAKLDMSKPTQAATPSTPPPQPDTRTLRDMPHPDYAEGLAVLESLSHMTDEGREIWLRSLAVLKTQADVEAFKRYCKKIWNLEQEKQA